jgi:hypothetical protein
VKIGVTTVGTSAVLLFSLKGIEQGVLLKAPGTDNDTPNTATVYVGTSANVTADQTGTGGFPLEPGESRIVPADSFGEITLYAVSGSASQHLNWLVV